MSKDRARRRAARESAALADRRRRAAVAGRRRRWSAIGAVAAGPVRWPAARFRASRRAVPDSVLRRRRTQENITLAGVLLGVNVLVWLFEGSWGWRASALVLSLLAWPVLAVLIFDRRASS